MNIGRTLATTAYAAIGGFFGLAGGYIALLVGRVFFQGVEWAYLIPLISAVVFGGAAAAGYLKTDDG